MKNIIKYISILFITIVISSCSTTTSQVKAFLPTENSYNKIESGIIFSLPKSLLKLDITYSLYTKKVWEANGDGTPKKSDSDGNAIAPKSESKIVVIETPINISTFVIPDQDMRFIFSTNSMSSSFKEKDFNLTISKEGVIKTFNSVVTDKSSEFIGNITGVALNLAKIAAVAGVDVVELTKEKDIFVSRIIDVDNLSFASSDGKYLANYSDLEEISLLSDDYPWPEVTVEFEASYNINKLLSLKSTDLKLENDENSDEQTEEGKSVFLLTGIPYRSEGVIRVRVKVDDAAILDKPMSLAHAGPIAFIPIESSAFESTTHKLEFHDNSGQLSSFQSKGGASAATLSGALNNASKEILTSAKELNTLKIDTEINKLKKQKELLDAKEAFEGTEISKLQDQIDLLKKQKELVDAQDSESEIKVAELQSQIDTLKKEKELADLQKSISGTEITSLQEHINLLTKQKELAVAQQSLNDLDTSSSAYQLSQLDQQKLLLDKQRELKRAEINDMSVEIDKLKKQLELLDLKKKISSSASE